MQATTERVLIIGGGIGGMTLAAALHQVGVVADVYEQAPEITEVGAGVGLWSNALFSLEQIGAAACVRRNCLSLRKGEIVNAQGKVLSAFDLTAFLGEFSDAACYIVYRPTLLAAISDQVPRQHVHTAHRCVAITQDATAVEARFDNGVVAYGTVLVGADGLHSVVRRALVTQDQLRYSGQTCFRGIAHMPVKDPGVIREIQGAGKRCAVCPMTTDSLYWWTAQNAREGKLIAQDQRRDFLLEAFKRWPSAITEYIAATPVEKILQNDLYDRAPIAGWSSGRVTLLGDAAHPTTPNLGQGANMAIDDAIVLARVLTQADTVQDALRQYEAARLARTTMIVRRSWRFGALTRWKNPLMVKLREWVVMLTPQSVLEAELRRQILQNVGTLDEQRRLS